MSDTMKEIKDALEQNTPMSRQLLENHVVFIAREYISQQKIISDQSKQLEVAVKALEIYTTDEFYCGRCGGVTQDVENGQDARDALAEITGRNETPSKHNGASE